MIGERLRCGPLSYGYAQAQPSGWNADVWGNSLYNLYQEQTTNRASLYQSAVILLFFSSSNSCNVAITIKTVHCNHRRKARPGVHTRGGGPRNLSNFAIGERINDLIMISPVFFA